MTRHRACGGQFRRSDIRTVVVQGKTLWEDIDPLVAHWKCSKCGWVRTQRKRQPGKRVDRVKATTEILEEFSKKEQWSLEDIDTTIAKLFNVYGIKPKE